MLDRLASFVTDRAGLVLVLWSIAVATVLAVAPRWDTIARDGDLAYLPAEMPSARAQVLLQRAFPERKTNSQLVIVLSREAERLTSLDREFAETVGQRLETIQAELGAVAVWTPESRGVGEKLASRDGRAALIVVHLGNEFLATDNMRVLARVQKELAALAEEQPAGLLADVSGSAAVGGDMLASAADSIKNTELATITLVILILLLVYRAPGLILVPLVTIGVSIIVSMRVVALLTQLDTVPGFEWWNFEVFTTTRIFIVVILFGAGADFCLFLIARYREELGRRTELQTALRIATSQVGEAIIGSALTTILGLATMAFADFGKFRNSGPAIAICLAITLLASLTLAPALLRIFGPAVFWPSRVGRWQGPALDSSPWYRFWSRIAEATIRRPGLILASSLLLMAPLAWLGRDVEITYDLLNELAADRPSVIGTRRLTDHFPPGEAGPTILLAMMPDGGLETRAGKAKIAELSRFLETLEVENDDGVVTPAVAMVRSLSQPLGEAPKKHFSGLLRPGGATAIAASGTDVARASFLATNPELAGRVARFDLILPIQPFAKAALARLDGIEEELRLLATEPGPWHGAQFYFAGVTAGARDLRAVTESDRTRIERLVSLAVAMVLLVIVRRPVVCLFLIGTVLLSYFVTLGVTVELFRWLYPDSYQGLDWKVPLYLFVILIAIGEDYNIYLVTRVAEEQERHGPLPGLKRAVAQTGGIITSCGVIMAGTFVSMTTGSLRGVQELGFALSLGVLCDTLWVRPVLAPAFLALIARWDRRHDQSADPGASVLAIERIEPERIPAAPRGRPA